MVPSGRGLRPCRVLVLLRSASSQLELDDQRQRRRIHRPRRRYGYESGQLRDHQAGPLDSRQCRNRTYFGSSQQCGESMTSKPREAAQA